MEMHQGDKLIERILREAQLDADAANARAQENCQSILSSARRRAEEQAQQAAAARDTAVNGVLDGARTRAELEGRKQTLAMRRSLLDEAFLAGEQALNALSGQKRERLLRFLLESESAPGDEILPSSADRTAIEQLLPAGRTLSKWNAPYLGGFLIRGSSYEKDCSFAALMAQIRQEEEGNVSRILFG